MQTRLARQTYLKLEQPEKINYDTNKLAALEREMTAAQKQGDKAALDSLRKHIREIYSEAEKGYLVSVRAGEHGVVDTNVVDLYVAHRARIEGTTNFDEYIKPDPALARRLGQVALQNGKPTPATRGLLAHYGGVRRKETLLTLSWVTFDQLAEGAPTLVNWLCGNGCSDFHYEVHTGSGLDDD